MWVNQRVTYCEGKFEYKKAPCPLTTKYSINSEALSVQPTHNSPECARGCLLQNMSSACRCTLCVCVCALTETFATLTECSPVRRAVLSVMPDCIMQMSVRSAPRAVVRVCHHFSQDDKKMFRVRLTSGHRHRN